MASWLCILNPGSRSVGVRGPFTRWEAMRKADKLENEKYIIVNTATSNKDAARSKIKEEIIEEFGYELGKKNVSWEEPITQENQAAVA